MFEDLLFFFGGIVLSSADSEVDDVFVGVYEGDDFDCEEV